MEWINLSEELDFFSDQVADGRFAKLPYPTWKRLRYYEENGDSTAIEFNTKTGEVIIADDSHCTFHYQDDSFGKYLWECTDYCINDTRYFVGLNEKPKTITTMKNNNEEKEENTMNFNFEFGPVKSDSIKMSIYGLAVKNASGTYVSYNDGSLIDVDILNFDGSKFLYKMPVALKEVKVGDVVVHARKPMFVTEVLVKSLKVVDPVDGEAKEVLLTKSPFGFDFATKVVNFLGSTFDATANSNNPFGNMWMLFALAGDNSKKSDMLLPIMMMSQGGLAANPMAMYALLSGENKNMENMFAALAVMGAFGQTNPLCAPTTADTLYVPVNNPNQTIVLNKEEASN